MKDENKTKVELIKELKLLREEREKGVFEDITELEQAEQSLQESENRFRELFNHMSSGVAVYEAKDDGKDFIFRNFNRAAEKIDKVKKEDIIGKSVLKVFPGVKDFDLFKVFQEVWKTGKPQHYPLSLYQDQRITGWRENYIYKLPSGAIVAVYDDITERKQAEKELKDSEERLKILFDYAPDAYYISDLKGLFIDGNKVAERLIGYKREELIGKSFLKLKLLSLVDLPKAVKALANNLRGLPTGPDEFVLNRKDNSKVMVEISTYPVKIKGKTLVLGLARDITERKKMEERERYFKQVLLAIRKVNQLIVQETDPEHLIDQACQILTETLGYYNSWIALLDEGGKVTSTAASNFDDSFTIFEEQLKQGKYPHCMKKAFQEKGALVVDSISDSCHDCPLYSGQVGRAVLSGRIQHGDKLYGLLSVSIPREYADLEETLKLFIELAGDLGLALYKIALIEEHKQAEEELRLHAAMLDNVAEGVYLVGLDDLLIKWTNERFARMFGYDPGEMVGKQVDIVNAPAERTPTETRISIVDVLKETGEWHGEVRNIKRDGTPFWCYANVSLFDHPEYGKVMVSVHTDITERKQAEEALRTSEVRYRLLVENANEVILVAQDGILKFINRIASGLIGYSNQELVSRPFLEFIHPDDRNMVAERYLRRVKGDVFQPRYAFRLVTRDGNIKWVEIGTILIDWEGRPATLSFLTDITERKQAEEALQKAHNQLEGQVVKRTKELQKANLKLQELDQLKSMFIASMSHELRTPLSFIAGFTDIILNGISGEINEEQIKQLTLVKNSASHLLSLINDLIDINKIETGKVEIIIKEFDLSALSREIKDNFTVAADKKGLELSLEVPPLLLIEGEERRTQQILVNLLSNALKFTARGGIKIKIVKKDQMVEIAVRDTGIGIRRREDMDKLFKPFSRVSGPGKIGEGSGLGLYLSKKNANLLGGDIMVESEFGKGSVFTLILPLKYKEDKV